MMPNFTEDFFNPIIYNRKGHNRALQAGTIALKGLRVCQCFYYSLVYFMR